MPLADALTLTHALLVGAGLHGPHAHNSRAFTPPFTHRVFPPAPNPFVAWGHALECFSFSSKPTPPSRNARAAPLLSLPEGVKSKRSLDTL